LAVIICNAAICVSIMFAMFVMNVDVVPFQYTE
jgi:hypothetical protein